MFDRCLRLNSCLVDISIFYFISEILNFHILLIMISQYYAIKTVIQYIQLLCYCRDKLYTTSPITR